MYQTDSQSPLSCHPPGCLTCSLAVGPCHPSCYTSFPRFKGGVLVSTLSDTHTSCRFGACSSASFMLVKNISMLKHLNPGQVHQLMYFIVVSVHDREAELLTGIVVLFRSRKSESDLNIGLVFHSFRFLGVYSSPPQFKHFISSCHQKMFHPSIHPCNQHLHTSNIRHLI